jgi:hypothetical protein
VADSLIVDQIFGRKQSWGNQLYFRPSVGQAGKPSGLPLLGESLVKIERELRSTIQPWKL